MFRALSARRSQRGYEQLLGDDETSSAAAPEPKLSRAKSLPAKILLSCRSRKTMMMTTSVNAPSEQLNKASKIHPFFSLFETRRKKKATARPEFSRYMEYVKEGGVWDMGTNMPVVYYK